MKPHAIILLAIICLLGVRALGLHAHWLQPGAQQTANIHLATASEDADAAHAVSLNILGSWLSQATSLPPPAGGALLILFALLCLAVRPALPRALQPVGASRSRCRLPRPPSQAPPR